MEQDQEWLIDEMLREMPACREQAAAWKADDRFLLLRALMNLRPPLPAGPEFLARQDRLLQGIIRQKGVTDADALPDAARGIALWRGDITTLRCDAIVNAANSALLGCFCPNHGCIDNAIHTFAGVQLRLACAEIMRAQGRPEPEGQAKITPAFNLPSRYVLHTVGPAVRDEPTARDREALASCYRRCLDAADSLGLRSVAFCCISTGVFRFPNAQAAEIAVGTVRAHPAVSAGRIRVIFDVFREEDAGLYRQRLATA